MSNMINVVVYVFRHTHRHKAIVKCAVEAWDYYYHILSIFDVDNTGSGLKTSAVCTLGRAMCDALVDFECVRMQRLHRAACLVAEVQCAFVGPLWSAFDTTREAHSFPIGINNLEAS